eukprot:TRINITY_DN9422_c0_g1_i1.p1 TRINITY_DN9422_c0_g1~~TRINITY_DN9422_c0_g1_i1.p1  ORF type:complete len:573 (+),score=120.47 TRINITY_DN9422_c0_g1_i1:162-1880(+)
MSQKQPYLTPAQQLLYAAAISASNNSSATSESGEPQAKRAHQDSKTPSPVDTQTTSNGNTAAQIQLRQELSSLASSAAAMTASSIVNSAITNLRQEVYDLVSKLKTQAQPAPCAGSKPVSTAAPTTSKKPQSRLPEVVRINVGGRIFTTTRATLCRVPGSYLARIFTGKAEAIHDSAGMVFVDRNPGQFERILDALREPAAIANLPLGDVAFQRELEFYGLAQVFGLGSKPTSTPLLMTPPPGQDRLLALGGLNENNPYKYLRTAECYNPVKDEWTVISDMFWDRAQSGVVSTGSNLYVLGGRNEEVDAIVGNYNSVSQQWQEALDMTLPDRIYAAGFALVRDRILMVGGCLTRPGHASSKFVEVVTNRVYAFPLDPTPAMSGDNVGLPRQWQMTAPMIHPRGRHACAVAQGTVYALGGIDVTGKVVATVERFNFDTRAWELATTMPEPRRDFGCVVAQGKIYVIGGASTPLGMENKACSTSVFEYDPRTDTWRVLASMRHARQGLTCSFLHNKVYAVGGSDVDDIAPAAARLKVVERLDLDRLQWEECASMNMARSHLGSGVVAMAADSPS